MKRRGEPQRQASGGEGARALPPGASTPSPGGGHFYFGQTPDISTLRGHGTHRMGTLDEEGGLPGSHRSCRRLNGAANRSSCRGRGQNGRNRYGQTVNETGSGKQALTQSTKLADV